MLFRLIDFLRNPKPVPARERRAPAVLSPDDEVCTGITYREARFMLQSLHRLEWRDARIADCVLLERKLQAATEGRWG